MLKIVILGAQGRLGVALRKQLGGTHAVIPLTRNEIDLRNSSSIQQCLSKLEYDIVINCAALTDVDYCETHVAEAEQINGLAVGQIAQHAQRINAKVIHISTDFVFKGDKTGFYVETDATEPISVYGRSKLLGERELFAHTDNAIVLRTSWLFGLARPAFPEWLIEQARHKEEPLRVVGDKFGSPTSAEDAARIIMACLPDTCPDAGGVFHLCNRGNCSWADYGRLVLKSAEAQGLKLGTTEIEEVPLSSIQVMVARRPLNSAMSTEKLQQTFGVMPLTCEEAIERHVAAKCSDL